MSGGGHTHAAAKGPSPSARGLDLDILHEAGVWKDAPEALVRRAALRAYEIAGHEHAEGAHGAELCIVLADDAFVRNLNKTYRGKDKPTNVLSFPASAIPVAAGPEPLWGEMADVRPLGDIVLAEETIAREAAEQGKSFADHLSHLVVHGVLHLLGQDHEANDEAEAMEALERDILAGLGIADPYAAERTRP